MFRITNFCPLIIQSNRKHIDKVSFGIIYEKRKQLQTFYRGMLLSYADVTQSHALPVDHIFGIPLENRKM